MDESKVAWVRRARTVIPRQDSLRVHRGMLALLVVQSACGSTCGGAQTQPTRASTHEQVACEGPDCGGGEAPSSSPAPVSTSGCPEDMVEIPAGTFTMGHPDALDNSDEEAALNDGPPHEVTLTKPFCIDRTEVTVADYRACMEAGRCNKLYTSGYRCHSPERPPDPRYENHPVNCVSWLHAENYCAQQGKRLPTEAEWEYAARGSDGRLYPWGNQTDIDRRGPRGETGPAGGNDDDVSAFGVRGMGGNVSEWVWDWYVPYPSGAQRDPQGPRFLDTAGTLDRHKVYRGHNYENEAYYASAARRGHREPSVSASGTYGVRCARDVLGPQLNEPDAAWLAAQWLDLQVRREAPQSFDVAAPTPRSTTTWARVCQVVPECADGCEQSLADLAKLPPRYGEGRCNELETGSEVRTRAELKRRLLPLLQEALSRLRSPEKEVLGCDLFLAGFSDDQEPCYRSEFRWLLAWFRSTIDEDDFSDAEWAKIRCSAIPSCARECLATLRSYHGAHDPAEVAREGCEEIRSKVLGLSDDATVRRFYEWGRRRLRLYTEGLLATLDPMSEEARVVRCWMQETNLKKGSNFDCVGVATEETEVIPDWLK